MKKFQRFIACLFLMGLVTGCATRENVQVPQAFLGKPNSVLITQLSGLEKPEYYQVGAQGVADIVINRLIADSMTEKIQTIDAKDILEDYYYKRYGNSFENASFKVTKIGTPINKETLTAVSSEEDGKYAPYDFRFLKTGNEATYALIIDPESFGVIRPYYSFIPTGAPKGYVKLSIYIVNLADNSIVGEYKASVEETVKGEWDNPPHYLELVTASKTALTKILNDAHVFLFSKKTF